MKALLAKMKRIGFFHSDREVVHPVTAPGMEKGVSRDFGPLPNGYSRPLQSTLILPCVK